MVAWRIVTETLYYQVMEKIKSEIMNGNYPTNSMLPSEVKLQEIYGVSRVTLRNAIEGLVKDGLVERIQGKGSFVRKPNKVNRLIRTTGVESFTKVAQENGFKPTSIILKKELEETPEKIKKDVASPTVWYVKRIRLLDDEPIMLENNYFPSDRFLALDKYNLNDSIYELLVNQYGIKELISDDTTLSVVASTVEQARLLKRSVGFPLFLIETVVKDELNNVVQVGKQYIVSNRYQFKI